MLMCRRYGTLRIIHQSHVVGQATALNLLALRKVRIYTYHALYRIPGHTSWHTRDFVRQTQTRTNALEKAMARVCAVSIVLYVSDSTRVNKIPNTQVPAKYHSAAPIKEC